MRECKDCPDRDIKCHSKCRDYKINRIMQGFERNKRFAESQLTGFLKTERANVARKGRKKTGGDNYANWRKNHR